MDIFFKINMDNAAFSEAANSTEVSRILRGWVKNYDGFELLEGDNGVLKDSNGNTVGSWGVK